MALGAYMQSASLEALADDWLPVALVSLATLVVSLASGVLLARTTEVDEPTGALGMIAGGASGIVGMADELGADDRLVAFMQYLRVLVVVVLTPLVVLVAFPGGGGAGGPHGTTDLPGLGPAVGWLATPVIAVVGVAAGRLLRVPAGTLLGPLILSAALTVAGDDLATPELLQELAFALIGLQVGLRFTPDTLRSAGRLLVPVLAGIFGLIAISFGLAVLLAATTSASLLDAYLATTPGGLYAVLAAAVGANADTTFIVAIQSLRVLVMVLLAPAAVRLVLSSREKRTATG